MMKSGQIYILLTILISLTIVGCSEVTGGFEEYAGVNLIDGHIFDPGINTDWQISDVTGTYINFTDRNAFADDTGLSADAIAAADKSGLNIPNLVPGGVTAGDFENGITGWTANGNTIAVDSSSAIDGINSLDFNVDDPSTMITFDLTTLTDFDITASYRFLFSYRLQSGNGTSLYFEVNDGSTAFSDLWTIKPPDTSNAYSFPYNSGTSSSVVSGLSGSPVFAIGSVGTVSTQAGYLDNFRVVRTDVSPTPLLDKSIYFNVPLTEAGRLSLVSGTYRFSVWIRNEDTNLVTPTVANTFPSNGVTLRMESLSQNGHTALFTTDSSWSSWQQISVTGSFEVDTTTDPAIRLSIMPALYNDQDCGIMLIAYPQLMLIP